MGVMPKKNSHPSTALLPASRIPPRGATAPRGIGYGMSVKTANAPDRVRRLAIPVLSGPKVRYGLAAGGA